MRAASLLAGLLAFTLTVFGAKAEAGGQEEPGVDRLFSATMKDVHGAPMTLSRFRGRPLIVNFWARVCPPCRDEIPELAALQAQYKEQGLVVLGIALEDEPDKAREFLAAYGADYPAALAGEQEGISLMRALGNTESFLPFTLLIDRKGEIVLSKRGIFSKNDFQGAAGKLLRFTR